MRKEIIYAIIAGGLLGVVIAFGIWRANLALKVSKTTQDQATPAPSAEFGISLVKPENNQVLTTSTTTLSGATKPGVTVVSSLISGLVSSPIFHA